MKTVTSRFLQPPASQSFSNRQVTTWAFWCCAARGVPVRYAPVARLRASMHWRVDVHKLPANDADGAPGSRDRCFAHGDSVDKTHAALWTSIGQMNATPLVSRHAVHVRIYTAKQATPDFPIAQRFETDAAVSTAHSRGTPPCRWRARPQPVSLIRRHVRKILKQKMFTALRQNSYYRQSLSAVVAFDYFLLLLVFALIW